MQLLAAVSKTTEWSLFISKANHSYHSNPSLCPDQYRWRSWSWMVLWRPTRPSRTNIQKRCPFHHRRLECKSRKSRDTWSNRQVWPWSTKWSRAKMNRVLPRECNGQSKQPFPTTQEKALHGHHQMVNTEIKLIILFAAKDGEAQHCQQNKTRSWLWLRSRPPYLQIHT